MKTCETCPSASSTSGEQLSRLVDTAGCGYCDEAEEDYVSFAYSNLRPEDYFWGREDDESLEDRLSRMTGVRSEDSFLFSADALSQATGARDEHLVQAEDSSAWSLTAMTSALDEVEEREEEDLDDLLLWSPATMERVATPPPELPNERRRDTSSLTPEVYSVNAARRGRWVSLGGGFVVALIVIGLAGAWVLATTSGLTPSDDRRRSVQASRSLGDLTPMVITGRSPRAEEPAAAEDGPAGLVGIVQIGEIRQVFPEDELTDRQPRRRRAPSTTPAAATSSAAAAPVEPPRAAEDERPTPTADPEDAAPVEAARTPTPGAEAPAPPSGDEPIATRDDAAPSSARDEMLDQVLSANAGHLAPARDIDPALPSTLSRAQVQAGLRAIAPRVRNCGVTAGQPVTADIVIDGDTGRPSRVTLRGELARTTEGRCVARAVRRASFPRFNDESLSVRSFPLVVR